MKKLYVGVYGDLDSPDNKRIVARAMSLADQRHENWPLDVAFYDAASANVWGA